MNDFSCVLWVIGIYTSNDNQVAHKLNVCHLMQLMPCFTRQCFTHVWHVFSVPIVFYWVANTFTLATPLFCEVQYSLATLMSNGVLLVSVWNLFTIPIVFYWSANRFTVALVSVWNAFTAPMMFYWFSLWNAFTAPMMAIKSLCSLANSLPAMQCNAM